MLNKQSLKLFMSFLTHKLYVRTTNDKVIISQFRINRESKLLAKNETYLKNEENIRSRVLFSI